MDYFTADYHFGHKKIMVYCGRTQFLNDEELGWYNEGRPLISSREPDGWIPCDESVERMNQHFVEQTNAHVARNDRLWIIGDFCFPSKHRTAARFRNQLRCRTVNFVEGNHDSTAINDVFSRVYAKHENLRVNGQYIVLDHYARAIWLRNHKGAWMLYGHSHTNAEEWLDRIMPGRKSMDVGIDNAFKILGDYRPFSFHELKEIMDQRPGIALDFPEGE